MSLVTFLGAAGSFARIQQFLGSDECFDTRVFNKSPSSPSSSSSSSSSNSTKGGKDDDESAIILQDTDVGWEPASAEKPAQLRGLILHLPRHKLSLIIGPVGCGKSTLVQTLLGELPALAGSIRFGTGFDSVAYCAQSAWHMNGTVREAIVGVEAVFDANWYDRVVYACALKQDFGELPAGDASRIGSGGIALSGGQSQRIVCISISISHRSLFRESSLLPPFYGLAATTI
jgi:ATP-binding cassette, subfamily C (CFTR/MRP), member 1